MSESPTRDAADEPVGTPTSPAPPTPAPTSADDLPDAVAAEPEPEAAVQPEPGAEATPEPEATTEVSPEPEPEATTEAAPEPEPEPEPEAEVQPEPEDTTEVSPEPEPEAEVQPEPEAEATTEVSPEPAPSTEATPSSAPKPAPVPRPTPRPTAVPRPPKGRPVTPAVVAPHAAPTVPAPPDLSEAEQAEAAAFGRVAEDGTVWVREASGEREVGQYPGADPAEAIAFYVRRFADLNAKVGLFETRLTAADLPVKEIDSTLEHLAAELEAPAAVGDLDALRGRLEGLRAQAAERRAAAEAERAAARQAALEARTALVEAAEKISGTDPAKMQWRPAGEQLRVLLDQWKDAQRHGPRLDRPSEDALWKRFSHARSTFDRERRRWFAELEKANQSSRETKERIVAEAEALTSSTDWGATSAAYRELMTRWKAAGRANRKDDDALWARFRAAQDAFFAARDSHNKATDAEYSANLEAKLALLEEAERLVPVTDLAAAKAALRSLQDRWERVGKVPRADVQRVEGRLRAVEQAVRDAEQSRWQRTNPETRARAEGAAAQLVSAIAAIEADLAAARDAGNTRKVKELEESLAARRAWLEQVERAAAEARG